MFNANLQAMLDSVPRTEAGAIDLTEAKRIAEGGTHVLYRFQDAPFVIKVMKQNPGTEGLEELNRKYAVLYDCFDSPGKQRCILEQRFIHPVLLPGKKTEDVALSFVPYEKCFQAKEKFDFKIEPAELDPWKVEHHQALIIRANETLLSANRPATDFSIHDYAAIDTRIGDILKRLDSDASLRDVMSEFLTHYRDFYQRTNIILDAMGFENILFFKDEAGDWQFKVGSAIKHDTGKYTTELFSKIHAGVEVNINFDTDGFVNATHAYFSPANIRAVNVCAMKLGIPPVIDDVTIDPADLISITQKLSAQERMLAYASHDDFEKVTQLLDENKGQLDFNIATFWAYQQIADEYIKHVRPVSELKHYLTTISTLNVVPAEKTDDTRRIEETKMEIQARARKITLHEELLNHRPDLKPATLRKQAFFSQPATPKPVDDVTLKNQKPKKDAPPGDDSTQQPQMKNR